MRQAVSSKGIKGQCYKLFTAVSYKFSQLARVFASGKPLKPSLFCLRARPGAYPTRVEHLKGVSLGKALALSANTKLSWKGLRGTNTLASLQKLVTYYHIKFYNIGPRLKDV